LYNNNNRSLFLSRIFSNRCQDKCGILSLRYSLFRGTPGTNSCQEVCTSFPNRYLSQDYQCGSCSNGSRDNLLDCTNNVDSTRYNMCVHTKKVPNEDIAFFEAARLKWTSAITGDLSSVRIGLLRKLQRSKCGGYPINTIDDVYVCAVYEEIDGPYGVLGYAGPSYTRSGSGIPAEGELVLDAFDVGRLRNDGRLSNVIAHEIGHIIGVGSLWRNQGLVENNPNARDGESRCPYVGRKANSEYQQISGCPAAPTENNGGAGTACSHWDNDCMRDELMTGFSSSGPSPMSRVTIGSLEDFGYRVNYSAADEYNITNLNPSCVCLGNDERKLRNYQTEKRRLSDKGYSIALEYGRSILRDKAAAVSASNTMRNHQEGNELVYVGHEFVSVLYMENDEIYGVAVTQDDIMA
jgi:hypothetical protein